MSILPKGFYLSALGEFKALLTEMRDLLREVRDLLDMQQNGPRS